MVELGNGLLGQNGMLIYLLELLVGAQKAPILQGQSGLAGYSVIVYLFQGSGG